MKSVGTFVATLAILMFGAASAQDASLYDGQWHVKAVPPTGRSYEVVVKLKDKGGPWKALASNREEPCAGRESPITF